MKYHYFSKRKWKYFHTYNHFYSEKSSKRAKEHKSTTMTPNLRGINMQSPQSESTPRRLTLGGGAVVIERSSFKE